MNNTLIVGFNREAIRLYEKILYYPALGYKIIGFVSINKVSSTTYNKVPVLGTIETMKKNIKQYNINTILIAIAPIQNSLLSKIINICIQNNVEYQIVSEAYEKAYGNTIREIYYDLFSYPEFSIRRFIDLIGSILLIILLFPVFIIISSLIKMESSGTIFYSKPRVGKNGKHFRLFKFRVMVQESEHELAQDSSLRITNVGNFLIRTRIDELPQLINIFKGDMSFIGPNPERPFFIETFKQKIPFYNKRLEIKPGLMGWAQVNWEYDESILDIKEKLAYDLFYIDNRKISFDVKIIFLTILAILIGKK